MEFKAAFTYKFASMTSWPEGTISSHEFRLCVLGDRQLGDTLEMITSGKEIEGRPVTSVLIESARDADRCQILFIPSERGKQIQHDLRLLRSKPVLTVSDADGFVDRGGMIQLVQGGDRLRFDVNRDAAAKVQLNISARILRLAKRVIDSSAGAPASPSN